MQRKAQEVIEETKQLIIFKFGEEEFGVDILQAKEVERLEQEITRVPKAPSFVEGVINLRGDIVPVVELRKRFSLTMKPFTNETRIVIVEINENLVGMIVDAVIEVLKVKVSDIETAPQITKGVDSYFISGVAKIDDRLIVLLNMERALSAEEMNELIETGVENRE